ncbi:Zn-ribbon domain-containing OB-fold protein [Hydrogenophaga sp. BPS33]|uniref:Zn-ribbon domain-containing OB-fold protein n=1 Tax=Hydrogenophaga sp. BPS33 TaxID=2651974 RepID=UPI00131FFA79|nr:OB-fold domain-containing protein [Hydrogenophaga sp. BPS33]QHE84163.1 hypothetical protein F9K07_04300 [Hydrogenophaga sp. BPS33]
MTSPSGAIESPMGAYQRRLNEGVLAYQYSPKAQRAVFYPRVLCPFTGSADLQWRESRGEGTVHAVTYLYPKGEPPYNVVLVDLDDGFRMMSRVEGNQNVAADQVRIGMRVRVRIRRQDGADAVPFFEPIDAQP